MRIGTMKELINLLLIDDNQEFLESLSDIFSDLNYSIRSVPSITEAEKILQKSDIDAIISDYNLIDSTGIDLLARIRKDGLSTPFILISGNVTTELVFSGLRLGAFEILDKPLDFEVLEQTILHAINCGIQFRNLQERIRNKNSPEEAKIMLQLLKMTSMLRFANYDRIRLTKDNLPDVG